jgi:hypothetical protein
MQSQIFALSYEGIATGEIGDQLMQCQGKPGPEIDSIWGEEALRRLASVDARRSQTFSADEVFGQD